MSLTLYMDMDVHVKRAVTDGLRRRGVDVLTAQEDGMTRVDDAALLDRASSLGRVLFSQDDDCCVRQPGDNSAISILSELSTSTH